ncbi:hypothetical protein [Lichenicoccus sp.]|uniref:hypothetical protein n=1 Tax=Lichenicoccus sp. TaxID=2781899 RepID=UPI003D0A15B0
MKNIQVIDGAQNCVFAIFQAEDDEFALLFPEQGQDIQFAEDISDLRHAEEAVGALSRLWTRPIRKRDVQGIHGTLFCGLQRYRHTYPTKREDEVDPSAISPAQRALFRGT